MRIINTATANPAILDTMGSLALYSGMDNLTLFEIRDGLEELMTEGKRKTYAFEMELQAALLEMSFNGCPIDLVARNEMRQEFSGIVKDLTTLFNEMLDAIGYFDYYTRMGVHEFSVISGIPLETLPFSWDEWKDRPLSWRKDMKLLVGEDKLKEYHKVLKSFEEFNPNSPVQKLRLFYHFFGVESNTVAEPYFYSPPWLKTYGIKEIKARKSDGSYGPSTDRDALEKIIDQASKGPDYAAFWAAPFAKVCLDIADLVKSLGFLNCKLDNGYFRASFGATTETGRLNSRKNAMGYGANAQNTTPKLRHVYTVPPGWKLSAPDYSQIESCIVAAICFRLFGSVNYLAMTECGDAHTLAASMVWDKLPWPEDFTLQHAIIHGPFPKDMIKAAKKIAGGNFYRHFSYRDAVKRLGHGSNYMGKPAHMAAQTHIPKKLIEHFQDGYFGNIPELLQWHGWVAEQVQTTGEITTMLGRTRRFFGRPNDDATLREAVAFEPQSVAADYTNTALLRIVKAHLYGIDAVRNLLTPTVRDVFEDSFPTSLPVEMFLQKHDELAYRYLEPNEEKVNLIVTDLMEQHITLTAPDGSTRDWYVPTEMETGWNLGAYRKAYTDDKGVKHPEKNPNGLSHPDPTRKRKPPKSWKEWKL